jgi:hypothetical protein
MALAAAHLSCRHDLARGYRFDSMGRQITGCHECIGCESAGRQHSSGMAHDTEVLVQGNAIKLRWACPGCGFPVQEDTSALTAIQDAAAIKSDPLCVSCRSKSTKEA